MSRTTRLLYVLGLLLLYLGAYHLTQTTIKSSDLDLLTEIDQAIPFMPEHIWIYHTLLPAIVATMTLLVKRERVFFNVLWASLFSVFVLNAFYVLFPVFYPRPEVLPSTLSEIVLAFTHEIDAPNNTFPSGHVTFAWILFLGVFNTKEIIGPSGIKLLYFLWAIGVTLSTLTLKQHYVADIISGVVLACISFFLVKIIINKYHLYPHN